MVVYEWEVLESFFENSKYFDFLNKYLLFAQVHTLNMFALKIILKNVQRSDVEHDYITNVLQKGIGMKAMNLARTY